ncbi:MAG: hypothetical protein AAGA54_12575 [Myxococcota bacterium]
MLKKVAIALGVGLTIAALIVFVLYRQLSTLPEWADAEVAEQEQLDPDAPVVWEADGEPIEALPLEVAEALPPDPVGGQPAPSPTTATPAAPTKKKPKRYVLKGFHRKGKGVGKTAVRASKAVLENGRLEAGLVLDLSRLEDAKMSDTDRGLYEGALDAFPPLRKKNVYVGVETKPVRTKGVLQLGKRPKLRIGSLRYDLATVAGKLGMSEAALRKNINRNLRTLGFNDPGR